MAGGTLGRGIGMRHERFEDLPDWQAAIRLASAVFDLTQSKRLNGLGDLRNQLERAALSVSNNIAEGWERGTHEELLTFLYYARGSCGEVRSMLRFLSQRDHPEIGKQLEELLELATNTSRQLGGWLESLKNANGRGHRQRNDATRRLADDTRRQAEFLDYLRRVQDEARRSRDTSAE
jgi:four helix bundle protein